MVIDDNGQPIIVPGYVPLPDHPVLGQPYGGRAIMWYVPNDKPNGVYVFDSVRYTSEKHKKRNTRR